MVDNIIQSVHRAGKILSLFSYAKPLMGISEISRALKLDKGTVQGLVRTLTRDGFLEQDVESRKYHLGLKIYELGVILSGTLEINQKASNPAHQLANKTQHLVRVAILDKNSALVTMDAYPRSRPFISPQFGPRAPLYCTALGKALLAFLEPEKIESYLQSTELVSYTPRTITQGDQLLRELSQIRKRGYSINRGEHFLGRDAMGAPIWGRLGAPVASISLSGLGQVSEETRKQMAGDLMNTASEISQLMGFHLLRPL